MRFNTPLLTLRLAIVVILLSVICTGANSQAFDELLGDFRQSGSGVCVIYGHVLALAEADPVAFKNLFHERGDGWVIMLAKQQTFVSKVEVEKSVKNGYSAGDPTNLLTAAALGISKRTGGYKPVTGELTYGPKDYAQFIGTGKWTLYDNSLPEPGRTLADGLARLVREAKPDGTPGTPSTMGFGDFPTQTTPELAKQASDYKLNSIHDFAVAGYDAEKKIVKLRNPHNPVIILEIPMDFLKQIPAGIDFMEPETTTTK